MFYSENPLASPNHSCVWLPARSFSLAIVEHQNRCVISGEQKRLLHGHSKNVLQHFWWDRLTVSRCHFTAVLQYLSIETQEKFNFHLHFKRSSYLMQYLVLSAIILIKRWVKICWTPSSPWLKPHKTLDFPDWIYNSTFVPDFLMWLFTWYRYLLWGMKSESGTTLLARLSLTNSQMHDDALVVNQQEVSSQG